MWATNNVGNSRADGGQQCGQQRRATTWATTLAAEDVGGEKPYSHAVTSAAICDCHAPPSQLGLTLAIDSN